MKTGIWICVALSQLLAGVAGAFAQFTPDELARRGQWEAYLRDADLTGSSQMKGSEAVTSPWKLTLKLGDVTGYGLWKNPEGRMGGFVEGWEYEVAAYLLDKHLGLGMVPPTIERRFRENRGSLQLWIPDCITLKQKEAKAARVPPARLQQWNRATYLQRAWDNLIANDDRHSNQILITADWRMILIDHSRSFRSSKKYFARLIYGEKGKEGVKLMSELPRAFVEKLKALSFDVVRGVVGPYLTDAEITAVLIRRDLILTEIDRLVRKNGEGVLY